MSLYFLLGTLSSGGRNMIHNEPNLLVNCTSNIDIPGAKILGTYAVLGRYDYVLMVDRSEEHTSELQSQAYLVCRLLLEKKKHKTKKKNTHTPYTHSAHSLTL